MGVRDPDAGRMGRPKVGCGSDSDQGTHSVDASTRMCGGVARAADRSAAAYRRRQRPVFPVPPPSVKPSKIRASTHAEPERCCLLSPRQIRTILILLSSSYLGEEVDTSCSLIKKVPAKKMGYKPWKSRAKKLNKEIILSDAYILLLYALLRQIRSLELTSRTGSQKPAAVSSVKTRASRSCSQTSTQDHTRILKEGSHPTVQSLTTHKI